MSAGRGALTLHTSPEGAAVEVWRCFDTGEGRLEAVYVETLEGTPIEEAPLYPGSYRLLINAVGCAPVVYPVVIEAGVCSRGVAPGEDSPTPIVLPEDGELSPNEVYIPAGWFEAGGDDKNLNMMPPARWWSDAFIIQRLPVSVFDYQAFLDDLSPEEAARHAPSGQVILKAPRAPEAQPVVGVDWFGARAYAQWLSAHTGEAWRLPRELEWEKAARGVDARRYPWGDQLDPSRCQMIKSSPPPGLDDPRSYPMDVSPYGVLSLGGNSADWCEDAYVFEGPLPAGGALRAVVPEETRHPDAPRRVYRGGAWQYPEAQCLAARRGINLPEYRGFHLGFRLVRGAP